VNPAGLVVDISRFGAGSVWEFLDINNMVAERAWAAGLWDFVWSWRQRFLENYEAQGRG
jgi:hypothetical protein